MRSVLLRPAALPTEQNGPLFEQPDLTRDGYYVSAPLASDRRQARDSHAVGCIP